MSRLSELYQREKQDTAYYYDIDKYKTYTNEYVTWLEKRLDRAEEILKKIDDNAKLYYDELMNLYEQAIKEIIKKEASNEK